MLIDAAQWRQLGYYCCISKKWCVQQMDNSADNRDAYRVQQNIVLECRCTTAAAADSQLPEDEFDQGQALALLGQLKKIDREASQALKMLSSKNRLLGDYLQKLNTKLDLLARYSLLTHTPEQDTARVSISETGILFQHPEALSEGSFLAIKMIFLPTYLPLILFARVARNTENNGVYQIAAEFYKLCDSDRQVLTKQIFKAQVENRNKQAKPENH